MNNLENINKFRFWCHKIIPLAYDDSLSYYEFLCKVMQKLNEVIDSLNAQNDEIERFETDILAQFEALRTEVRNRISQIENYVDTFRLNFVEDYSTEKSYLTGDYVYVENTLLKANAPTSGEFDESKWDAVIFANDFATWRRQLVSDINTFITNITNLLNTWLENIATEYDTTRQYITGDICSYQNKLYLALGATSGTFDGTKWVSIVLTEWIADFTRNLGREKTNKTGVKILEDGTMNVGIQADSVSASGGYQSIGSIPLETRSGNLVFVITFPTVKDGIYPAEGSFDEIATYVDKLAISETNTYPVSVIQEVNIKWFKDCGVATFNGLPARSTRIWLHWKSNPGNKPSTSISRMEVAAYRLSSDQSTSTKFFSNGYEGYGFIDTLHLAYYTSEMIDGIHSDIGSMAVTIGEHSYRIGQLETSEGTLQTDVQTKRALITRADVSSQATIGTIDLDTTGAATHTKTVTVDNTKEWTYVLLYTKHSGTANADKLTTITLQADGDTFGPLTITWVYPNIGIAKFDLSQYGIFDDTVTCTLIFNQASAASAATQVIYEIKNTEENTYGGTGDKDNGLAFLPLDIVFRLIDLGVIAFNNQGGLKFRAMSQADYDNLGTYDPNTIYFTT